MPTKDEEPTPFAAEAFKVGEYIIGFMDDNKVDPHVGIYACALVVAALAQKMGIDLSAIMTQARDTEARFRAMNATVSKNN